jgi:hypothetical protein
MKNRCSIVTADFRILLSSKCVCILQQVLAALLLFVGEKSRDDRSLGCKRGKNITIFEA